MVVDLMNLRIDNPSKPAGPTKSSVLPIGCTGSPDAIADYLDQYRQVGLDYVICAFESEGVDDLLRQMRTFSEQIAPSLLNKCSARCGLHRSLRVAAWPQKLLVAK